MSRLSDLIREAKRLDAGLGNELEKEVRHLQERRAFGLNFERHQPEAVDLYGRPVRVGDKVRMLPPRGETAAPDKRLWVVTGGATVDGQRRADLRDPKTGDTATHPVDDLVVVAENTDVIYPGLVSTGKVERGGDKPFHTVINAENLHALEALLYTHRGKVDAIYIDPPFPRNFLCCTRRCSPVRDQDRVEGSVQAGRCGRVLLNEAPRCVAAGHGGRKGARSGGVADRVPRRLCGHGPSCADRAIAGKWEAGLYAAVTNSRHEHGKSEVSVPG